MAFLTEIITTGLGGLNKIRVRCRKFLREPSNRLKRFLEDKVEFFCIQAIYELESRAIDGCAPPQRSSPAHKIAPQIA